jgi:hypothetical protein
MADDATDDDGAVEVMSDSLVSASDSSSMDVVSRRGEEMERLFVGECWLRLAPRRFRVGVGVRETSVLFSVVEISVDSSVTMVLAGSSTILVSIFIS